MGTFNYKVSDDMIKSEKQYKASVAVVNFKDERPKIGGTGKMWLYLVPLVPYGWGIYNRPEDGKLFLSIQSFKFNPSIDLAKASELSLSQSGLFQNIYYLDTYSPNKKPDYIFTGVIKSTLFQEKMFSYCLSVYGPLLWLIGAPDGWTSNQLEINFQLKNPKNGKVLWSYIAEGYESRWHWFYYQGQDVKDYVPVMTRCMNNAIIDLQKYLKTIHQRGDVE
jgi:hypothetical protein